ncbi:MAG: conserved exported protein of unknown function [Rhodospirillaceae bacterium]|nr:MAG: conserved exported protein of unknown function [Rhodospirillaceae bacterium]
MGPVSVTAPVDSGSWMWQSPGLKAVVHPFDWSRATFHAPGVHTIRLSRHGALVTLSAGTLTVAVNYTLRGQPQRYAMRFGRTRIEGLAAPIDVQFLQGTVKWSNDSQTIVAVFDGAGIDLPPALDLPVGARVEAVGFKSRIIGTIPPGDLAQALARWREAGGTVEVEALAIDWPPLKLHGSGTLALDEQLQPIGAMTARIQGFFAAVDSLSQRGVIRSRDASMAKVILGMLAQSPPEGGPPVISLPLTVQERTLQAGPVRLIRLPDIRWSARHDPGPEPRGPVRLLRPHGSPVEGGE